MKGTRLAPIPESEVRTVTRWFEWDGVYIDVSKIDEVRTTRAFAQLREKLSPMTDDDLIDLLLAGLNVEKEGN